MPGYELIGKEERDVVNSIFDKSGGVLSRYGFNSLRRNIFRVEEFEKELAKKLNVKYVLCLASGTAALKAALLALGVKSGDEVITQSFTFVATVEAILDVGTRPVITEVDRSLNMDPMDLERKITDKTKVIIPVHMQGVPAKMDEIMAIARKHKIPVLEDCAQAIGGTYKGMPLGTIGDVGAFSLDFSKAITTGEGGFIATNNKEIHRKVMEYQDHGHENNPNFPKGRDTRTTWGFSYKMTELQGAIGLAQIKKLDYIIQKQRENKRAIKDGIKNIEGLEFRDISDEEGDAADTLIFFVKNREQAEKFEKLLVERGMGTKNLPDAIDWHFAGTWTHIFYDFSEYRGKNLEELWPKSTNLLRRAVAIPIYVKMDKDQINNSVQTIKEILSVI
jgi:8-amino-3,8-dideoxy-alpha-D-manno-octulosonate transaminase